MSSIACCVLSNDKLNVSIPAISRLLKNCTHHSAATISPSVDCIQGLLFGLCRDAYRKCG